MPLDEQVRELIREPAVTPYDLVKEHFKLPFELYPFQSTDVNELGPLSRSGLYYEPGLGKTPTSTTISLYKMLCGSEVVLIVMPPTIITQWERWLRRVKRADGTGFSIMCYRGSKKQRAALSFGADFILMGIQIFKRDYERVVSELNHKRVHTPEDRDGAP